jgi:hypothetical protein
MFEYKVLTDVPKAKAEELLNRLAAEGWRVVSALHFAESAFSGVTIILERPAADREQRSAR